MIRDNKGIDISKHQGVIDWDKVKAAGVQFAIIRIGWGHNTENQDDKQAVRNMAECERIGIPYGVYIYSYALTDEDAKDEAAHAIRMVQGHNPVLGIYFDMEDADKYKVKHGVNPYSNRELLTGFCLLFCEAVAAAGYKTGVYASKDYFKNVIQEERIKGVDKWLAQWGASVPSVTCLIWQYTSDGVVDGINGRVDMNQYYGELPKLEAPVHEPNKEITPAPQPTQQPTIYKVGDKVEYNKIYVSSTAGDGLTPKYKTGIITGIAAGKPNPYLIGNGTGWVNDTCIISKDKEEEAPAATQHEVKNGDTLSRLAAKYGTTVNAIVAGNKSKYPKITRDYIVVGWVLTV